MHLVYLKENCFDPIGPIKLEDIDQQEHIQRRKNGFIERRLEKDKPKIKQYK